MGRNERDQNKVLDAAVAYTNMNRINFLYAMAEGDKKWPKATFHLHVDNTG